MKNTSIFCLTLNPDHIKLINELTYIPVGLGEKNFSKDFLTDKIGEEISTKNPFYGEYTFHYWIWKNHISNIKTKWVGFCQYRKFFSTKKIELADNDFKELKQIVFKEVNQKDDTFDCLLGEKFSVENYKISKILKNHLNIFLKNPSLFFIKKKRTLKFHFDLFHGHGNFDKALEFLDDKYKNDFNNYMNEETSFHPHNMFICKTEILKDYYEAVFPWLSKCEDVFGFKEQSNYGLKRIYGFLAERFLSFWFTKNYKIKTLPIVFKNLSDYKDL